MDPTIQQFPVIKSQIIHDENINHSFILVNKKQRPPPSKPIKIPVIKELSK